MNHFDDTGIYTIFLKSTLCHFSIQDQQTPLIRPARLREGLPALSFLVHHPRNQTPLRTKTQIMSRKNLHFLIVKPL